MKLSSMKKIRGQGMSEYLVIVALIAVAAIAVTALFGNVAKNQVAAIANEVSGSASAGSTAVRADAVADAGTAVADAQVQTNLSNFTNNAAVSGGGTARAAATQ